VWSYDFVSARTHDGRSVRLLNLIDEHTRESLLVRAERRWSTARVISALADVMVMKGVPEHLRSDNGPEFVAKDLRKWLAKTGAKTLYIEPGSPWENGYCESFNSKLRDEFLNGEIFYSMKELRVLAERWRVHYNTVRPHSSLGYRSPANRGMADKQYGACRSGNRYALPTSTHPRRRLLELRNSCVTLTHHWHKRSGTPHLRDAFGLPVVSESDEVFHPIRTFGRRSARGALPVAAVPV
jgi:putative transposase